VTVFRINTFEVDQGKAAEFVASQREVANRQAAIGGFRSRRVLRRASGDKPFLTYSVVFEFDDWEAAGKFSDAMAIQNAGNGGPADGPNQGWRIVQANFATEVTP